MTNNQPFPVAEHSESRIYTSLTYAPLSPTTHLAHVRTPEAGALVLFAGTTRDTFDSRPVANLTYQAYVPLALATLTSVAKSILAKTYPVAGSGECRSSSDVNKNDKDGNGNGDNGAGVGDGDDDEKKTTPKRGIKAIAISHRLGVVPIGEESILIAVSAAHRTEAWRAGEECLEEVKKRTEIWKLETFADGGGAGGAGGGEGEAVWRANNEPAP